MTPSVADKTSYPVKVWRRHTDPPILWVAVVIGSLSLHLLAFWLIRSYQSSLLWRQQSKAAIPIEVIEIASQPKSRTKASTQVKPVASKSKPISSKPSSTNQKLQSKNLPKPVVTTKLNSTTQDKNAVAFTEQQQRKLAEQQQHELAQQRQRKLAEQQQHELAQQRQRKLAEQQQRENAGDTPNQKSSPQPSNAAGGSLIASLVGEPQQDIDRHTHSAKVKPSKQPFSKGLEYVKYIEQNSGKPVEFTVILTISEKGKLEHVAVADQSISEEQKSYYEDFVGNQVLNGWEFEPAYDNNPNDPKPSNLIVRIKLQPLP